MKKTLITIPTYNEKENIEIILDLVFKQIKDKEVDVLVVEDNSPDGTAEIVKRLINEKYRGRLNIMERKGKLGLASAYVSGFKWGLEQDYELFIEMDADCSHDPAYLPEMLSKAESYDFVIGSRYVKNGGVKGWGPLRKFISRGGSLYSKMILFIPFNDLTGGFNLWTREVLEKIGLDAIISSGYSFQVELKYKAYKHGFKGVEIPIIFEDRTLGKSKMSKKIFLEAIINIWKIKFLKIG